MDRVPALAYFMISAVFHYLGPAFAVLLFAHVDVLGVAWLRITAAAVVFGVWRRPWRAWARLDRTRRVLLLLLGCDLAAMNAVFYLAIDRLPLGTVGAIEFAGPVLLAALGLRGRRNAAALLCAAGGVYLLMDVAFTGEPLGFVLAFANCALFTGYVVVGHRVAGTSGPVDSVDVLGAAMLVAAAVAAPVGLGGALPAFGSPDLLAAGVAVGVCSSVIPYVADQKAMAKLPRQTFALLLSLLPATATVIGLVVLTQTPGATELAGVALVMAAVALHKQPSGRQRGKQVVGGRVRVEGSGDHLLRERAESR